MLERDGISDTILVAQDGSPAAQAAAGVAIQLARSQNLLIQGLYVVDEALALGTYTNYHAELGSADEPTSRAELIAWLKERGNAALQWLEARCQASDVFVTTDLLVGGVPELVLREAAQVQLLAMGRRGHGHAGDPDHLGRNFRAIAHHARQPILVGGDEQRLVQRLLLAYNGSERAQHALTWASLLQRTLSAEVLVLAVQESTDASRQWPAEMQSHLAQSDLANYRFLSRRGQPATEIVAVAAENQVDLIVMGRYRHTALLEWLVDSTVDRVLRSTQLPALIV